MGASVFGGHPPSAWYPPSDSMPGAQHQSETQEIEVTEAMIAAGREPFFAYDSVPGGAGRYVHCPSDEQIRWIYRAMERARRKELWG